MSEQGLLYAKNVEEEIQKEAARYAQFLREIYAVCHGLLVHLRETDNTPTDEELDIYLHDTSSIDCDHRLEFIKNNRDYLIIRCAEGRYDEGSLDDQKICELMETYKKVMEDGRPSVFWSFALDTSK